MGDTAPYKKQLVGDKTVKILIPSRRKDKRPLDPGLILEQNIKSQAKFQEIFGGTSPDGPPRIGTWRHDDGSVTREQIQIVEAITSDEKLTDDKCREEIEKLAADICHDMDQDCVFVSWGKDSFIIEDNRPDRNAQTVRFALLPDAAQEKMVHLGWMGIHSVEFINQVLSLDGWDEPKSEQLINGCKILSNHEMDGITNRAIFESTPKKAWPKKLLNEGDVLFSPADNGIGIRLFHNGKIHGPKILYFSDVEANPKTHLYLSCLLRGDNHNLSLLLSKKDVRQGFFKAYKTLLEELESHIEKTGLFKFREYHHAQLLLGRLMFLKFIEQRGWLAQDKEYLVRHLPEGRGHFYHSFLLPLFFDVLNNQNRNTDPPELPYLNGGLFHPRENEQHLNLPDDYFRKVFDLFNRFEFTVKEAPGSDEAVAVDPSMFGKVLESLIDPRVRKKSGIHYTPAPIAHALAFEAILNRLTVVTDIPADKLRRFCYGGLDALLPPQADKLNVAISQLRILDPAVGSGALLLACLEVMMSIAENCHEVMGCPIIRGGYSWGRVCRELVCNCLFGVDLAEEAVEIARLRLWLAVAVGDEKPSPLPNLEFNILQADSLLEEDGLNKLTGPVQMRFDWDEQDVLWNNYFDAISSYQRAGVDNPIEQHQLIRRVQECQKNLLGFLRRQAPAAKTIGKKRKALGKDIIADIPFSWRLHFGHVFQSKGGFDIVIANPPYVRIQNIDPQLKKKYTEKWSVLRDGSADLYYAFIQLALDLASPDGVISFIMPNFSKTASGASLRRLLSQNATILRWVDFDDTQVFKSATNYVALLFAGKRSREMDTFACSCVRDKSWIEQSTTRWIIDRDPDMMVDVLYDAETWSTVPKSESEHLKALQAATRKLGDLVDISVGIQTSADLLYLFEKYRPGQKGLMEVYSRGINRWVKIEPAFLRICIKGARAKSTNGEGIYLLWPYGDNAQLLPPDVIESQFPHGWAYLKKIEKKLRGREKGKFNDNQWYRFGRSQGIETCMRAKVIVPAILNGEGSVRAVLDEKGEFAFTASGEGGGGAWGLMPISGINVGLGSFADYLRSDAVWRYIQAVGFPKRNGWRGVDKSVLSRLPVPENMA